MMGGLKGLLREGLYDATVLLYACCISSSKSRTSLWQESKVSKVSPLSGFRAANHFGSRPVGNLPICSPPPLAALIWDIPLVLCDLDSVACCVLQVGDSSQAAWQQQQALLSP